MRGLPWQTRTTEPLINLFFVTRMEGMLFATKFLKKKIKWQVFMRGLSLFYKKKTFSTHFFLPENIYKTI